MRAKVVRGAEIFFCDAARHCFIAAPTEKQAGGIFQWQPVTRETRKSMTNVRDIIQFYYLSPIHFAHSYADMPGLRREQCDGAQKASIYYTSALFSNHCPAS